MNSRAARLSTFLIPLLLLSSVGVLRQIDRVRGNATLQEVLYLPSPSTVRHVSLGYTGLMADLYWTRAVQYFGTKHHAHADEYKLLEPLLDITTELDPHLEVAYEFGSIFLAQAPPEGAGNPQAAVRLVERGIRENPRAWRLYYHLGFIQYQELHDAKAASESFARGAEIPGAMPWMRVMAAALAQASGEADTARFLWMNILSGSDDPMIKSNAVMRLRALDSDRAVLILQQVINRYIETHHEIPNSWTTVVSAGLLRGIPRDPVGNPYMLRDGHVEIADTVALPFATRGLPPGKSASQLAPLQSNR